MDQDLPLLQNNTIALLDFPTNYEKYLELRNQAVKASDLADSKKKLLHMFIQLKPLTPKEKAACLIDPQRLYCGNLRNKQFNIMFQDLLQEAGKSHTCSYAKLYRG